MSTAQHPSTLSKHQHTLTVDLDAPIDACFAAALEESAMMAWVPHAKSVVYDHSGASRPYGPGSVRTVTLSSGMALVEHIFISEKPTLVGYYTARFGYGIDALLKHYQGRMHFESIDAGRTRLTWKGYFDCPGVSRIFEPLLRMAIKKTYAMFADKMRKYLVAGQAQPVRG